MSGRWCRGVFVGLRCANPGYGATGLRVSVRAITVRIRGPLERAKPRMATTSSARSTARERQPLPRTGAAAVSSAGRNRADAMTEVGADPVCRAQLRVCHHQGHRHRPRRQHRAHLLLLRQQGRPVPGRHRARGPARLPALPRAAAAAQQPCGHPERLAGQPCGSSTIRSRSWSRSASTTQDCRSSCPRSNAPSASSTPRSTTPSAAAFRTASIWACSSPVDARRTAEWISIWLDGLMVRSKIFPDLDVEAAINSLREMLWTHLGYQPQPVAT